MPSTPFPIVPIDRDLADQVADLVHHEDPRVRELGVAMAARVELLVPMADNRDQLPLPFPGRVHLAERGELSERAARRVARGLRRWATELGTRFARFAPGGRQADQADHQADQVAEGPTGATRDARRAPGARSQSSFLPPGQGERAEKSSKRPRARRAADRTTAPPMNREPTPDQNRESGGPGGVQVSRKLAPGVPPDRAPIELQTFRDTCPPPRPPPRPGGGGGVRKRKGTRSERNQAKQHARTAWARLAETRQRPAELPPTLAACVEAGVSQAGGWRIVATMGDPAEKHGPKFWPAGERPSTVRRAFLAGFIDAALALGVSELGEPGAWV